MFPNPYVILSGAAAWLASLVLCGWLMYARGHDDMRNAYTEQQLTQANTNLRNSQKNQDRADQAGFEHEQKVQVVHDTTREIVRTVSVPADADPYVPVWFVRLWDRLAGRSLDGDAYPGKSESAASDVRLSEVKPVLAKWADDFYACRQQVADIVALKPVLPAPKAESKTVFDRLNPF